MNTLTIPKFWKLSPSVLDMRKRTALHMLLLLAGYEVSPEVCNYTFLTGDIPREHICGTGDTIRCFWSDRFADEVPKGETREKIEYSDLIERAKYMIEHDLKPSKITKI